MDKVVILARVSTDKQEYQRQLTELREYCSKVGWEVVREFANKVSGAKRNDERPEIVELIEFVKSNDIRRVVCLEISRLGRNTLEALKVIQSLNEHHVSLYVKNYNLETLTPEGDVNPVASLITTILLETLISTISFLRFCPCILYMHPLYSLSNDNEPKSMRHTQIPVLFTLFIY